MKLLKIVSLTVIAVGGLTGASAQAALPEYAGTFPDAFTLSASAPKLQTVGALEVLCGQSHASGEIIGPKQTTLDELFLECKCVISKINAGKATGLTDTVEGSILMKASKTLGYRLGSLEVVVAESVNPEVHFECGGSLAVLRGCVVGIATPLTKSATGTREFTGTGGKQTNQDYTNDKGETVSCKLESSLNGGTFIESALIEKASLTVSKEFEIKD